MTTKVVIIGAIGTAVVIAEQIYDAQHRYNMDIEVLGFAFDDPEYIGRDINGWPILCGTREAWNKYRNDESVKFVFSLYSAKKMAERVKLRDSFGIPTSRYLTFIHPSAFLCKSVKVSDGVIILANTVIHSNSCIDSYTIIMSNSQIGHDVHIGGGNFIGARSCIGSFTNMQTGNFTGNNCSIRTKLTIGSYNIIGMGAVLVKSIGDCSTVVGNPAKAIGTDI